MSPKKKDNKKPSLEGIMNKLSSVAKAQQEDKGKGKGDTPTKVSKPSLWQLLIQLKAEDASMKAKMMAITTGAWKDNNPGRSARRTDKKAALKSLVENYYTMDPGLFLEAAIGFFNESWILCLTFILKLVFHVFEFVI